MPHQFAQKLRKPRILLVDDSDDIAALFAQTLGDTCSMVRARTIAEARGMIERMEFDVIILDWHLAGKCGSEVLDSLPKVHGRAVPPVIIATGTAQENLENTAATSVLRKPFTIDELERVVQQVFSRVQ